MAEAIIMRKTKRMAKSIGRINIKDLTEPLIILPVKDKKLGFVIAYSFQELKELKGDE